MLLLRLGIYHLSPTSLNWHFGCQSSVKFLSRIEKSTIFFSFMLSKPTAITLHNSHCKLSSIFLREKAVWRKTGLPKSIDAQMSFLLEPVLKLVFRILCLSVSLQKKVVNRRRRTKKINNATNTQNNWCHPTLPYKIPSNVQGVCGKNYRFSSYKPHSEIIRI